jgi:hypothetical protein
MRIEINKGGIAHFALDVDGEWARSSAPHLLVLADYDTDNRLIGVTFAGPLARIAVHDGVPAALVAAVGDDIQNAITTEHPDATGTDPDELARIEQAIEEACTPALA